MTEAQRVEKEALRLTPTQRARVAARLLESLDELPQAEIQRLWADEAERRLASFKRGESKAKSAQAVFGRLRREVAR